MTVSAETLKAAQRRMFEMATEMAAIFKRNDIPYMLACGTLLGAVRHQGFIPWDDDFDLFLFDDSYDRALEALRAELPPDMFLEDAVSEPLYFHAWAHVKDEKTIAYSSEFPHDNLYSHKGLSIDMYRAKRMKRYELDDYVFEEQLKYIERRHAKGLISEDDYQARKARYVENIAQKKAAATHDSTEIFGFISMRECHSYEIDDVLPLKEYRFEGATFLGPANEDAILRAFYYDYHTLPPVKKRVGHYTSIEFV